MKVASAIPSVRVGDVTFNLKQMERQIAEAEDKDVEAIVFPELSMTGYTCQDLFRQQMLLDASEQGIVSLLDFTLDKDIVAIVGAPVVAGDLLLNCAVVVQRGQILGIVPKTYLPNYSEFYEKRWFASAQDLRDTEVRYAGKTVQHPDDVRVFDFNNFSQEAHTYDEYISLLENATAADIQYLGIALYGHKNRVNKATKGLSLMGR